MEGYFPHMVIVPGLVLAIWGGFRLRAFLSEKRRASVRARPFPREWEDYLARHVVLYRRLPGELKKELQGDIQVFLDEKRFVGAEGFEISDEVRVVVAAEACLLLLNPKAPVYPGLASVYIYPGAYRARSKKAVGDAFVEEDSFRAGESWQTDSVVLAWDYVERSAEHPEQGHNVVVHEFAHQLDAGYGPVDGVPHLDRRSQYADWARVFGKEYRELQERVKKHRKTVLDPYGATNPAEFFAVASEAFFTRPGRLKASEPELYEELSLCYHLDPATWPKA